MAGLARIKGVDVRDRKRNLARHAAEALENSIRSLPICSLCTAFGLMLSVISPPFTYSAGTWVRESTFTAICGV